MKFTKILVAFEVILILAASVSLMFVSGCGTTQLTNLWKDSSYNAAPLNKIMVIAIRKDQLTRRMWEDAFVTALKDDRDLTVAIPSYQIFPDEVPDTLEIRDKTKEGDFDGVLVVARIEKDTLTTNVPGYISIEPVSEYSYWWGAYVTHYINVYHPGYTETQTQVSVRTDLLLVPENGRLVWSGTSEEIDPSSNDQFRKSVAELVMDELKKVHFVH